MVKPLPRTTRTASLLGILMLSTTPNALLAQGADQTVKLDEVVVDANQAGGRGADAAPVSATSRQSATGPVQNYVAKTSLTGTKTATPLIETPQAISVIGAQQISDLGAQSIVEATRYTSGVLPQTFGADTRNDWYLIRGFPGQVSGYFLDGLQLYSPNFATYRVEPFGLERLEVLKGPASVLYGGSNVGGILNAVSKLPPPKFSGTLEGGIDNYGNKFGAFDIGGPVSTRPDNQFYYRVEGLDRGGGTQTHFIHDDRLFIAPSLTYKPDLATTFTVLGQYEKDRTNSQNFLPYTGTVVPAPFGKIPTTFFSSDPGLDTFQRNQAMIGYQFEHRFNDAVTIRQNVRYSDLRIDYQTLYSAGGYAGNAADANLVRFNFVTLPHITEFTADNNLEARFRTGPVANTALVGLDYKRFTLADQQGFAFGSNINVFNPTYYTGETSTNTRYALSNQVNNQVGVYLQEQAKLGHFTLVLSGRQDTLATQFTDRLTPTNSGGNTRGATTGRAGLIYTADNGLAPYATYATSFDPQLGTSAVTNAPLVPTTGALTEIGFKYEPIGRHISFNGALFNLVQNNVLTTNPANIFTSIQTAQQRSRGYEVQAQGEIMQGLTVLASFTGYHLTTTSDPNAALIGKTPVATPQAFGSLLLDYTIQDGVLRGLGAGAGPRYVGGSYATVDNTFGVPASVVADLNVHYDWRQWRAQMNMINVFDKTYVSACSTINSCFYDNRRKALFSLAYHW